MLPDDPEAVLRVADAPYLGDCLGHDLVTASGTTLLGADNKSGVAEIVTAAERLIAHPDIPHGAIRIAFTPDEEVGQGTKHFDVARFGARYAYTMDGGPRGELEFESFSADAITLTFRGFNTHPGFAKGRMVNAIKLAARFIERLPSDRLSPETTDGREGFVHPYVVQAGVDRTAVRLIVRDFNTAGLKEKEVWLQSLAQEVVAGVAGASLEAQIEEQYRNMREVLDDHPLVVERAREAIARAGLPSASALSAAARMDPGSRSWGCRHPISSPGNRTSTRGSSGFPCRTWRRPWTSSSSSRECGRRGLTAAPSGSGSGAEFADCATRSR